MGIYKSLLGTILGTMLTGFGIGVFLTPNKIVGGGVTIIDAVGAYTFEKKQVLFCALKESESFQFQQKILEMDESAFIVFSESQRIKGNGFKLYV